MVLKEKVFEYLSMNFHTSIPGPLVCGHFKPDGKHLNKLGPLGSLIPFWSFKDISGSLMRPNFSMYFYGLNPGPPGVGPC